jgi:hypothetical protein
VFSSAIGNFISQYAPNSLSKLNKRHDFQFFLCNRTSILFCHSIYIVVGKRFSILFYIIPIIFFSYTAYGRLESLTCRKDQSFLYPIKRMMLLMVSVCSSSWEVQALVWGYCQLCFFVICL